MSWSHLAFSSDSSYFWPFPWSGYKIFVLFLGLLIFYFLFKDFFRFFHSRVCIIEIMSHKFVIPHSWHRVINYVNDLIRGKGCSFLCHCIRRKISQIKIQFLKPMIKLRRFMVLNLISCLHKYFFSLQKSYIRNTCLAISISTLFKLSTVCISTSLVKEPA